MAREKYNREKEHTIIGTYPAILGMELGGAANEDGVCIVPESPPVLPAHRDPAELQNVLRG